MEKFHNKKFPGENGAYRAARDALLEAEIDLRNRIEAVAEFRRKLPLGGKLKEDYRFEERMTESTGKESVHLTRFSELFAENKDNLVIYSFMYPPDADQPCPMCTSILDSLDGTARHATDRINLAVVAKAPINKIKDWAHARGWSHLRLLSSGKNTYNSDYHAEGPEWGQMPAINVFRKTSNGIFHFYNSELFYAPSEPNQHPRHADLIWPLWNLFDLTPDGRGTDWFPKTSYR